MNTSLLESHRLSGADHQRVAEFINAAAGIQLPAHKRQLIEARLRKRLKVTGRHSITDYLDFVLSPDGDTEKSALVDVITTNKTDFFRESQHFDYLQNYVEQGLLQGAFAAEPLRVWSAACSTGEEPYTLAIVLKEIESQQRRLRFQIDATDICSTVLAQARQAVYRRDRIAPIPELLRKKYLLRNRDASKGLIRMDRTLREKVNFGQFNLITGEYPAGQSYDVIFCRNVMIYFSEQDRSRVISRLKQCLKPGGLLFLGHSETVGDQRDGLAVVSPTVYQRIA